MVQIPVSYYSRLARVESSNNPNARAGTSSASGLYQFTRDTWQGLGYAWKDVFNVDLQNEAVQKLTNQNASILQRAGIAINEISLYIAHFLGAGRAVQVLSGDGNAQVSSLVSASAVRANPFLRGMTVNDFKSFVGDKFGVGFK